MKLWKAHVAMCKHFKRTGLTFTLDGKLVGDIGEMMVADALNLQLCKSRTPGVDGHETGGLSKSKQPVSRRLARRSRQGKVKPISLYSYG
jgi:hypothetical protein